MNEDTNEHSQPVIFRSHGRFQSAFDRFEILFFLSRQICFACNNNNNNRAHCFVKFSIRAKKNIYSMISGESNETILAKRPAKSGFLSSERSVPFYWIVALLSPRRFRLSRVDEEEITVQKGRKLPKDQ